MYNIPFAYTKKKRLLLTTLCGLFFFAEDQKRNFSFKRKEKKQKKENFDPLLIGLLGFSAKPHCIHPLSRKVYYILTNSPPLGYDTREMAAPKKKKGEDVKRERERES
jgi:hypothetical protein